MSLDHDYGEEDDAQFFIPVPGKLHPWDGRRRVLLRSSSYREVETQNLYSHVMLARASAGAFPGDLEGLQTHVETINFNLRLIGKLAPHKTYVKEVELYLAGLLGYGYRLPERPM